MRHILKKSLKLTFASVLALKAGDYAYNRTEIFRKPCFALEQKELCDKCDSKKKLRDLEFSKELGGEVAEEARIKYDFKLKSRDEHLKEMMDPETVYDMLIIGGGASGAGVALDASSRGLKCAVIDAYDFASGTSSRSTKMAHGGLRYFEQMFKLIGDPFESFQLLKETLQERNYFLMAAPFQNKQLQLLIPCSSLFWATFFYYPGCLLYHLLYLKQKWGKPY